MAKVATPPERWIEEGFRALARGGPQEVRIDVLAKGLGVTRGGFYWHFSDRRALLDKMLDTWEREGVDEVISQLEAQGGSARERLLSLFAAAVSQPERLPVELAIRDWARRDESVRARLARVDDRRMAYMRQQFSDFVKDPLNVEVRCMLAFAAYIANNLIAATHDGRSREDLLIHGFKFLLEDDPL